jgi:hypothetical protein
MDPTLTWIQLLKRLQVSIGSMEPLEQRYPGEYRIHMEPLEQRYPGEYRDHEAKRLHRDPILTWIQLLKRFNGPHIHMDTVAQEAPWTLYSHGYSCSRDSS